MDADALNQIGEARSGHFVDWWAPMLDWMWRLLFLLHLSPGFVLLASTTIFVLSVFEILRCVLGRWAAVVATLLITAFPPVLGVLCSLSRDVWFGSLNLAAYALAVRCVRRPESNVRLLVALSLAAIWFGMAARQNGVHRSGPGGGAGSVPPVVPAIVRRDRTLRSFERTTRWVIVPATLAIVLVFAASQYVLTYDVIGAARTYPQQQLFQGDLAELSVRTDQVLEPRFIFPAQNLKALAAHTSPYTALGLLEGPGQPLVRDPRCCSFSEPGQRSSRKAPSSTIGWTRSEPIPARTLLERWQLWLHLIGWTAPVFEPYHLGIDQNRLGYRATFGPTDRAVIGLSVAIRVRPPDRRSAVPDMALLARRRGSHRRPGPSPPVCPATDGRDACAGRRLVYYLAYAVLAMGNGFRWAWPTVIAVVAAFVVDVVDRVSTLRSPVAHEVTGADPKPRRS